MADLGQTNTSRLLLNAALIVLAAADAAGAIIPHKLGPFPLVLGVVAVVALGFRTYAPYLAFALTVPALIVSGVVIAALVALFTVAERRPQRNLLIVCGLTFFVCYTALWDKPYSGVDSVLNVVYATIFTRGAGMAGSSGPRPRGVIGQVGRDQTRARARGRVAYRASVGTRARCHRPRNARCGVPSSQPYRRTVRCASGDRARHRIG